MWERTKPTNMKEKEEQPKEPLILEGIIKPTDVANRIYPELPLEEALKDSKSELSAEEQQEILKQIIQEAKQKTANSLFRKKLVKTESIASVKKKKARSKMQKKSRKTNRRKK